MAEDTIGLMDVLGIKSAHVVGLSMGGMIAQEIAISFPQRVALADLDHVDDRQSESATADPRSVRDPDGAAADDQRGIFRALRPDLEDIAGRQLPAGRSTRSRPAPNALLSAG